MRTFNALCLAAIGMRTLSMRPASIGPVKHLIRKINLDDLRAVMDRSRAEGAINLRPAVMDWLARQDI